MVMEQSFPNSYILRHGETTWNKMGLYQGRKDAPLTQRGVCQAVRQGHILKSLEDRPGVVFSSPQGRALRTAQLALGDSADIRQDERLCEIDFGAWEGVSKNEVKQQVGDAFATGEWNFESPGGESFAAIIGRVSSFLADLEEPAVIFTHGTTSAVMRGLCMGLDKAGMLQLEKEQGVVYRMAHGKETILR
ncbi:histidine phosphatase family protein [Paracoccus aestuarii]|uniref:Histidine phosphatase family protein n=1 Tax=Paracoccus aestuarii TaxID=453842 RepID=A0A418ZZ65_9RHOB|nr:histidine phosphatase family protein [Paracoccus aestuarii]RJL05856.1 histidine phosphatase family protein [Paracoccus aestuarii]WCQ98602.1 histidine phosphatase family protein [Paracoccus aestuarii]